MAALRGLLRWRRRRLPQGFGGDGGPESAGGRRLWGFGAGSGSNGAPSGLGVAAAGAAGGALAWLLCQRFFYEPPGKRASEERPHPALGGRRGARGGVGEAAQGRGLLPIPVAAAAKETTVDSTAEDDQDDLGTALGEDLEAQGMPDIARPDP
ncbi:UNVERIFIED_CONTAM: hypothetical protein K2H54_055536 [Gekko kuhli]